jgi:predicted molibdopterin-dependent oxidoreductase YjgC
MSDMAAARSLDGQFARLACAARTKVVYEIDGRQVEALEGDTVLTAVLTNQRHIRQFEFGPERRAGFCLIGACQDCWVRFADGSSARGCTTLIRDGMKLVTASQ